MPDILNRLGGRINDYYTQAKALMAPDPSIAPSVRANLGNVDEYKEGIKPQAVVQQPSPLGAIVLHVDHSGDYGTRPGERRLDLSQVGEPAQVADTRMRPLGSYASGTARVPQTGPYIVHKGEAVVPAAQNPNAGLSEPLPPPVPTMRKVLPNEFGFDAEDVPALRVEQAPLHDPNSGRPNAGLSRPKLPVPEELKYVPYNQIDNDNEVATDQMLNLANRVAGGVEILPHGTGIPHYKLGTAYVPEDQMAILHEGEAVVPAEDNPNNQEGAPTGFGGPVFSNPEHVKPQMDTEPAPHEPQKLSGGAEMNTEMAPLGGAKMDTANPQQNQIETVGQEASAKVPHTMTGTAQMGDKPLQVVPEDQTKKLSKQHEQIQLSKSEAAEKGDLVGLGTALIQEREFNKTGPMQEVMKAASSANAFPEYTGPNAKGSKAPEAGKAIDPKFAAEDEFMYKMKSYNEGIQNARDKGTPEGDMEAGHLERAKLEFQKQHPWGSAGNHPGVLGKIGHVLGAIGNVAGEALAPGVTAAIPGSRLNREVQDQQAQQDIRQGSDEQLQSAQATKATQEPVSKPQDQLAQNKLDAENKLKQLQAQLQNPATTLEQKQAIQQEQEQIYASNPEFKPKPEDQAKQPVGEDGVAQHQAALGTITSGVGLTPDQESAFNAAYGVKPTDSLATQEKRLGDAKAAAQLTSADRDRKLAKDIAAKNREDQQTDKADADAEKRTDKSYQYQQGRLDKIRKPVDDATMRFNRLRDSVSQNTPQADALVAPELLTVMAGGAGSGLRMNEAEIARIVGGRSHWETLKAVANKWQLDPSKATSITAEQRKEIRSLMDVVGKKLDKKQVYVTDASAALNAATTPEEHRKIVSELQTKLDRVDAAKVRVQIPGHPAADINEEQLEAFRKKYPDATIEE